MELCILENIHLSFLNLELVYLYFGYIPIFVLDSHNHFIVDHDLYNHDGMTQDGIAEAFIEFAKKEGLSFFQ